MSEEANGSKAPEGQPESSADPLEAGMVECPECHGSGVIVLLITSRPCTRCGGRGWIEPGAKAPEPEVAAPEPGIESYSYGAGTGAAVEVCSQTYDAQGRLTSETLLDSVEMKTYLLSDTGPGTDDDPSDSGSDADE